jgi:secreted trypsin-like serine protease
MRVSGRFARAVSTAVLAAVAIAAAPQGATATSRIVGGDLAPAKAYPWMVALVDASQADAFAGQFCGGQLIAARLVVTASHCAQVDSARDVDVIADTSDLAANDGERIKVDGISIHPAKVATSFNSDVAVLHLETATTHGQPIALAAPSEASLFGPGATVRALGWGLLHDPFDSSPYRSTKLLQVDVQIVSDPDCAAAYGHEFAAASMICAGVLGGGKDTCNGDSGGPLMALTQQAPIRWELVGVTSWGEGCARAGFPGVYARVANLRSFLDGPYVYAPYSDTAPAISGTPAIGSALTCSNGTWVHPPARYAYSWGHLQRDGDFSFVDAIPGATAQTYTAADTDAGLDVVCTVEASNTGGTGRARSAPVQIPAAG